MDMLFEVVHILCHYNRAVSKKMVGMGGKLPEARYKS
jgi:predicted alpha/beta hydrolase